MITNEELAAYIDHAVLKPEFRDIDLIKHAEMCIKYKVFSMCVKPYDISKAVRLLDGSSVKVSCVLSFPHGADISGVKVFQAQKAIEDGVDEIDMVMNIGRFLSDEYEYVISDIAAVVELAHSHKVAVKVIQESGYIKEFEYNEDGRAGYFNVHLNGNINDCGVIKPRFAVKRADMEGYESRYLPAQNFGVLILTTTRGVVSHDKAKEMHTGGRLLAYVY